mmetsp:Transcript_8786/g.6525  ORF Transcript_8786/g.6525 Transcript_8786/m.6525 type:complete len:90 (-) Transcript_8786:168-437(-)
MWESAAPLDLPFNFSAASFVISLTLLIVSFLFLCPLLFLVLVQSSNILMGETTCERFSYKSHRKRLNQNQPQLLTNTSTNKMSISFVYE